MSGYVLVVWMLLVVVDEFVGGLLVEVLVVVLVGDVVGVWWIVVVEFV